MDITAIAIIYIYVVCNKNTKEVRKWGYALEKALKLLQVSKST